MLKNIKSLTGVKKLTKNTQIKINGGTAPDYCPPGWKHVGGRCRRD
ncbi:hypothetical protein IWQ47_001979 [Aquimarina sp. EL_43]|nr:MULTISPECIES: hypothetical protein [unclassified Aquimarina]MBG6129938.1 hypothetical protein [Aquimarina sp. EL_35]MBG6148718.1 hypothetical protein [Aquimarina sp. EL_32]MBG6168908.1 hypothetical protein [Aquimarina sp. EL_43]